MQALLATKLHAPASPMKLVERPQLLDRLDEGLASGHQVFLVSAPAGFGKTTCITDWLGKLEMPCTWLSLDESDDDPACFFSYLSAALQKINVHFGREIEGVLRSGEIPPVNVISTTLINDLLNIDSSFLLVLDDFHLIQEPLILAFCEALLAHLPHPLHLVLVTREDPPLPLAKLRANNQLTEIRAHDLRFTNREADQFLTEVIGISLTHTDLEILENKTEGWIVGLQLAGLSIRNQENSPRFIASLSGSHRYILGYLTEQVLDRQSGEIQDFLLQTSILEKLNGDLCNAVTDRTDSQTLLEQLFKANLFLVPLDNEGQWYRYHHLFADLLQTLQKTHRPQKSAQLHQRASRWFAQTGMLSEAISHAFAGEDYAFAVYLLEAHALSMVMQGYAKTVNGWVERLPAEWCFQSPRSNLALAWAHLLRGTYTQASPHLTRLEGFFLGPQEQGAERQSLQAEWLVMQSLLLHKQGKSDESLAAVKEALELVQSEDHRIRSLAQFCLATIYQAMGKNELANDAYRAALQSSRSAGSAVVEMLSTSGLAQMAFEHGQLHQAYEIAAPVSEQIEKSDSLPPISTVIFGILGEICYQWHQVAQARHFYERALQLSTLGGYNSGIIGCRVFFTRLYMLEGDSEAAAQEIQKAFAIMKTDTPGYVRLEAVAQQVRVHLAQNRPAAAERALQPEGFSFGESFGYPDLPPAPSLTHSLGLLYNSSLRILLDQTQEERSLAGLKIGVELADRLVSRALASRSVLLALETLLLRARMHSLLGDQSASRGDYARALELAEPEHIISIFIEQGSPVAEAIKNVLRTNTPATVHPDYLRQLQDAFSALHPQAEEQTGGAGTTALIEPLTDREIDVLRLMAEGLKYKEIATRLFVSQNTVRYHVKSVYGKLNVNNRTQALKQARQLGLL
jgi:LuxR family transcriptional regulator, maltose regulon positive regulatory protein